MRVLLVQTSFLGDTILTTPVVSGLKSLYPQHELWVMTTPGGAELLKYDKRLAGIVVFDKHGKERGIGGIRSKAKELRSLNFERVYSVHRSAKTSMLLWLAGIPERIGFREASLSWLYTKRVSRTVAGLQEHDVLRNLRILGNQNASQSVREEPSLCLYAPESKDVSEQVLAACGLSSTQEANEKNGAVCIPYVCLAPGSAWYTKMWYWENYRALVKKLLGSGIRVVILGAPQEREIAEKVLEEDALKGGECLLASNLVGVASLAESMFVVKNAAVVVCNDSSLLHMASAFKVPTVAIFCSTIPEFGFGPWGNANSVVLGKSDLPCRPCGRHGRRTCPTRTESCMRDVAPELVERWVKKFLALEGDV